MQIILLYVPAKSPCKITLVNLTFILSDFSSLNAILWRYRKTRKSCGGCSITAWPTAGIHRYYQRPWHSRLGRHHYSHCRHSGDSLYHPSSIIEIVMMMMMTMMIIIKATCDRNFRGILWFNLISLIIDSCTLLHSGGSSHINGVALLLDKRGSQVHWYPGVQSLTDCYVLVWFTNMVICQWL